MKLFKYSFVAVFLGLTFGCAEEDANNDSQPAPVTVSAEQHREQVEDLTLHLVTFGHLDEERNSTLTEAQDEFVGRMQVAYDALTPEHKAAFEQFYATYLTANGYDPVQFLAATLSSEPDPVVETVEADEALRAAHDALVAGMGVEFENLAESQGALTIQRQAIFSCTIAAICGIVAATTVVVGATAGTIVGVTAIQANTALQFCQDCENQCGSSGLHAYQCNASGSSSSSGSFDGSRDSYSADSSGGADNSWTCHYQCN